MQLKGMRMLQVFTGAVLPFALTACNRSSCYDPLIDEITFDPVVKEFKVADSRSANLVLLFYPKKESLMSFHSALADQVTLSSIISSETNKVIGQIIDDTPFVRARRTSPTFERPISQAAPLRISIPVTVSEESGEMRLDFGALGYTTIPRGVTHLSIYLTLHPFDNCPLDDNNGYPSSVVQLTLAR